MSRFGIVRVTSAIAIAASVTGVLACSGSEFSSTGNGGGGGASSGGAPSGGSAGSSGAGGVVASGGSAGSAGTSGAGGGSAGASSSGGSSSGGSGGVSSGGSSNGGTGGVASGGAGGSVAINPCAPKGQTTPLYQVGGGNEYPIGTSTHLIWTTTNSVLRVPKGGGTTDIIHAGSSGNEGVAYDDVKAFVYWADRSAGIVYGKPLGGTLVQIATSQNQPQGVVVDGTHVYWTTRGSNEVKRRLLSGGTVEKVAVVNLVYALAQTESDLYVAALDGIAYKIPKGTGVSATPLDQVPGAYTSVSIAADGGGVAWSYSGSGIGGVRVSSGTGFQHAASGASSPAVALDANCVYWASSVGGGAVRTRPRNLSALAVDVAPSALATGVHVDATAIFWTDLNAGVFKRVK